MLRIDVDDSRVQAALQGFVEAAGKSAPLMREIGGIMHGEVERNFDAEGRPQWRDLYPATKKERAKKGYTGKMLQRTGRLVSSVTATSTEDSAAVGTNVAYAGAHQFGAHIVQPPRTNLYAQKRYVRGPKKGKFKRGKGELAKGGKGASSFGQRVIDIPARPFLTLPETGVEKIVRAIERFFNAAIQFRAR